MEKQKDYSVEEKLRYPIPYKWKIQSFNKAKTKATCAAYIDGDNVFGSFILPYRGTNEEGLILTEAYFYYFPYSLNIKKGIECGCGYTKDYNTV